MRRYHVAGEGWQLGDDLLSFDRLTEAGIDVAWKWDDAPDGFDTDCVCLFETLDEATDYQAEYGGTILAVELPDDPLNDAAFAQAHRVGCVEPGTDDTLWSRIVDEGYLAVVNGIPAEWLSAVEAAQ